ncbi:hypothetical protein K438DRAFT_1848858, partial [Mycena galopus ATCC 62051]
SLSFLKSACDAGRSLSEARMFRTKVDDCIASMASSSVVSAIYESLECRTRVLELSNELKLTEDPNLRTAMRADEQRIATFLVSIFGSKSDEEIVLRLEGDSAQHFLDVVQETLDRGFMMSQEHNRMALRIIRKLSESCDMLPTSLFIVGLRGGFGDIYRALYGDQRVALKRMRHFLRGSDLRRIRLKFCREALLWKDLHHPHILPFLGIDRDSFPSSLCMVSPWMEHGTIMNYLKTHGYATVDKLLYQIAQGLEYLHSQNIVHGDLRGANILIKEDWSACLTDFGLSIFSDATATMSTTRAGSLYWMAPELLVPERFGLKFARTPATDVYAFGCVCFELYTERPPFSAWPEPAALMKVLNGERPERPQGPPALSDILWQHVTEFLAESPLTRPSTQLVVQNMTWPRLVPQSCTPSAPPTAGNIPESTSTTNDSSSSPVASIAQEIPTPANEPVMAFFDLADFGIGTEAPPVWPDTQPEEAPPATNKKTTIPLDELLTLTCHYYQETAILAHESSIPSLADADGKTVVPPDEFLDLDDWETRTETAPVRPNPSLHVIPGYDQTLLDNVVAVPHSVAAQRPSILDLGNGLMGYDRDSGAEDTPSSIIARTIRMSSPDLRLHNEELASRSLAYRAKLVSASALSSSEGPAHALSREIRKAEKLAPGPPPPPRKNKWRQTMAFIKGLPSKISTGRAPRSAEDFQFANTVKKHYQVLYDYSAAPDDPNEISFHQGDIVNVIEKQDLEWWKVKKADGLVGLVPSDCLQNTGSSRSTLSTLSSVDQNKGKDVKSPVDDRPASESVSPPMNVTSTNTTAYTKALYAYTASEDDPNEISFHRGEMFNIVDKSAKWWAVQKADGTTGIVPSNYFQLAGSTQSNVKNRPVSESVPPPMSEDAKYQAKALYAYTASEDDPNEISFHRGEILDIVDKSGKWWKARKADGTTGTRHATLRTAKFTVMWTVLLHIQSIES